MKYSFKLFAWMMALGCLAAGPTTRPTVVPPPFVASKNVDGAQTAKWIGQLSVTDGRVREIAIRGLLPCADVAAEPIVDLFVRGNLSARLSGLELLTAWNAPVEGLDPWQPASITPERLAALKAWTTNPARVKPRATAGLATSITALGDADLAAAREEISRLLLASDPKQILGIRERLARLGRALLPEVYAQLRAAGTDEARSRLLSLRYRLVASDAIAEWPGGLEQLAMVDAQMRRWAAMELAHRAASPDVPLLLELFSDPDPLIREISLRALQAVGGPGAVDSLVQLLHDPEPNVRAAVLKQLAETPSPEIVPKLVLYIGQENDTDLVVHAVRVLRATKGNAAITALMGLMHHASWRVRAEAIDAAAEAVGSSRGPDDENSTRMAPAVYDELLKMLDDPDGFIVGRAVLGLRRSGSAAVVPGMIKATRQHPELTAEVVRTLSHNSAMGKAAIGDLRSFTKHPDAAVRAAAIGTLCSLVPGNCGEEILAGLKDPDSAVRSAAARGAANVMAQRRPSSGYVTKHSFLGLSDTQVKVDPNEWLTKFRSGADRPAWMGGLTADLEKMASAEKNGGTLEEAVLAAVALTALGRDEAAWPVLVRAAKAGGEAAQIAAEALPWLPWEKRQELFKLLSVAPMQNHGLSSLASEMATFQDARAIDPLWEMLARPAADIRVANTVWNSMQKLYFGDRYYDRAARTPAGVQRAATDAHARLGGSEMQRILALALLVAAAPADAATAAAKMYADPQSSEMTRIDALQVLLVSWPRAQGSRDRRCGAGSTECRRPKNRRRLPGRRRIEWLLSARTNQP